MKKNLLLLLFLPVFFHCNGQQVTPEEAVAVAKTQLLYIKGVDAELSYINRYDSNGHALLYEVVNNLGMAVLVTGNKQCLPVVGRYTKNHDTSIFEQSDLPCGLKCFLKDYINQVQYCFDNPDASSVYADKWAGLRK